ncbi:hypothetical protein FH972_021294 [Carpinus fangiana]|uniref:Glycoside hydrolase family 92 protein n=1 Tax=Carpinus fangiana TaxID=176857 RepID=A0A5N6KPJ1_9ROSI|nr:hypothetical protein FH972_021294 [Carpinus fangiana]
MADFTNKYHQHVYPSIAPTNFDYSGKTVLVFGISSVIGQAIARAFIEARADHVVCVNRSPDALHEAMKVLRSTVPEGTADKLSSQICDIADTASVDNLWKQLDSDKVLVDVLALVVADIPKGSTVNDGGVERAERAFRVNVTGSLRAVQGFASRNTERPKALLNISSAVTHMSGYPGTGIYAATKIAFGTLLQDLAAEYKADQIQIISMHPGAVLSNAASKAGFDANSLPWDDADLTGHYCVWAASSQAKFLHGRFVWVSWDVDELMQMKARFEEDVGFLKLGLQEYFLFCILNMIIHAAPILLSLPLVFAASPSTDAFNYDPLDYVDQLIGTSNGGNVFAGATLPYDTDSDSNQGGFTFDGSNVTGFSSLHDSGTGGSPSLGNFPLFAYASCTNDTVDGCVFPKPARATPFKNESLQAQPGYFALELASGVKAEMTTAQHTSLFRFTFPRGSYSGSPLILLDLTDLSDSRQDNATISVDPQTGRMSGGAVFKPSFGTGTYTAFFCADFKGAGVRDNGIFVDSRASADVKDLQISRGINSGPLPGGGFVRFNPSSSPVLARIGLSFISSDQACNNAEREIPSFDFKKTRTAARKAWSDKLNPIKVSTAKVNPDLIKNFYSGVYRTMVNPQNWTQENPLWQSSEPYFEDFYCLWDSFRSQLPFLTIVDPKAVTQMVRTMIDIYRHQGWLPDCRMSLCKGYTQGGSNADNILADAYIKGLEDGINWEDGYAAVVKDATVEPYDWSSEGRGGLDSWNSLGYVPVQDFDYKGFGTMTRSISRTLEYSYNDYSISQIAAGMGKQADKEKYLASSRNWQNLFKADQTSNRLNTTTSTGFKGFFQPRFLNQTWGFQDPLKCSNLDTDPDSICSLQNNGAETFESSIWEYAFFVPHDQARLITTLGGPAAFVKRLDYLHDSNITYIGNEPAFLTVFQYHYAGRPALSALRSHFYIPRFFSTRPDGLPGNDDSGAMGSFVAMAMLGLFPNPGQEATTDRRLPHHAALLRECEHPQPSDRQDGARANRRVRPHVRRRVHPERNARRQGLHAQLVGSLVLHAGARAGADAGPQRERLGHAGCRSAAEPGWLNRGLLCGVVAAAVAARGAGGGMQMQISERESLELGGVLVDAARESRLLTHAELWCVTSNQLVLPELPPEGQGRAAQVVQPGAQRRPRLWAPPKDTPGAPHSRAGVLVA